jgi:type I restriction enzyme M protein
MATETNELNQNEINGVAWKACDTFRGVIDPSEYKNYILAMLFLKYLSDVWKDHYEQCRKEYGDDKVRIERRMARERFVLPENCSFDYLYEHRKDPNVGELINHALDSIEEANKGKLEGVFRNIDFNSESALGQPKEKNKRLEHLLNDFNDAKMDLRPSRIGNLDIIGSTYEYLIARFASDAGKKGGEFYTPAEVATLLAKLLQPKSGERICDPACGSGSLLIRIAREIEGTNYSLYGQEFNGSTWALAKMNMFLHGIDNARIEWGDTIANPRLIEGDSLMKFDVVVANPPFSLDKWGHDEPTINKFNRFHRGLPPKSKGDYAFITHMIETMNENGGRVGVVVSHGVLFRGGAEGKIRQKLIEENLLDAVIGLPANLFYGTTIPAAILVFKKNKKDDSNLFVEGSRDYQEGKNQNKLKDSDIERIISTYNGRSVVDGYSVLVKASDVRANDFNLNIPRYVDSFEDETQIDIAATQANIEAIEKQLTETRKEMSQYLRELGV